MPGKVSSCLFLTRTGAVGEEVGSWKEQVLLLGEEVVTLDRRYISDKEDKMNGEAKLNFKGR